LSFFPNSIVNTRQVADEDPPSTLSKRTSTLIIYQVSGSVWCWQVLSSPDSSPDSQLSLLSLVFAAQVVSVTASSLLISHCFNLVLKWITLVAYHREGVYTVIRVWLLGGRQPLIRFSTLSKHRKTSLLPASWRR
jgi:hypothetical protein